MPQPRQSSTYLENERPDILPHLRRGAGSALDVGCGRGGFGLTLRRVLGPQARIVGVEAVPENATAARVDHGFDEIVEGYFPEALEGRDETFDLVTFTDVLEHMVDPWEALAKTRRMLTDDGRVYAAIPNIAWAPVLLQLARGRWEYADEGILDRTHLRFFTRSSMIRLFEESGYVVDEIIGMNDIYSSTWVNDPRAIRRGLKRLLARGLGERRYLHFLVIASARA